MNVGLALLAYYILCFYPVAAAVLQFTLQQDLVYDPEHDVSASIIASPSATTHALKSRPTTVWKPANYDHLNTAQFRTSQSPVVEWTATEMDGPDIEDRHTLSQLARMTGNAYARPGQSNWYDLDEVWNNSYPFGWQNSEDGFRGHVFSTADNSTVVLSIKGTTLYGATSKKDKFNDNLLFSCCCARVDFSWVFRQVCNCFSGGWRCDNLCLSDSLVQDSLFYTIGTSLIDEVRESFPNSNIWLVGHSLGGALASLLGATYGLPSVAFEAPGERLAATRLNLILPPEHPVTHVYLTSDPIPQGTCTGFGSPCAIGGYALETHCHLGKSIVYDTVGKLGWAVDVRTHIIRAVITRVLDLEDFEWEEGREVPMAKAEEDCVDCFKWEFDERLE